MIIRKVRTANFRSVGNHPIEFDYTETSSTLVTAAKNGSGKSSVVLHSLIYALYNKSYDQGTKLPDLVNSTNKKKLMVEVDFEAKGKNWKVRRGLKPNVFELYESDKEVYAEKHADEKQAILEDLIGMDYKTFCFTVALGKDRFVPFISMSTSERRHAIDTIWDLGIFSAMQTAAKKKANTRKKELDDLNYQIKIKENDINHSTLMLNEMKNRSSQVLGMLTKQRDELVIEGTNIKNALSTIDQERIAMEQEISELNAKKSRKDSATNVLNTLENKISLVRDKMASSSVDVCGCCGQKMPESLIAKHRDDNERELAELQEKIDKVREILAGDSCIYDAEHLSGLESNLATLGYRKSSMNDRMQTIISSVKKLGSEIKEAQESDGSKIEELERNLVTSEVDLLQMKAMVSDTLEEISILSTSSELLSDSGVKQDIIESYIPYLNERVNDYLSALDFPVRIEINSSFDVEIVSPNKQGLSVWTLSTGQKCRIDLALLFSLRDIAKSQAGAGFNLILLDETLENLSAEGVAAFAELMRTKLNDLNVVCISQRGDEFESLFDRRVDYDLDGDFTIQL